MVVSLETLHHFRAVFHTHHNQPCHAFLRLRLQTSVVAAHAACFLVLKLVPIESVAIWRFRDLVGVDADRPDRGLAEQAD
jgi:hypothetical protein